MNENIIACDHKVNIGTRVVLWTEKQGFECPNKRGRLGCNQHDLSLNDAPSQIHKNYEIKNSRIAYLDLIKNVYQFVLHYDVCYTSYHCHQLMMKSSFKGSHFYLDLDGTVFQTCDLYWKTNTAPADDKKGNERAVHVEIANLSWEALAKQSEYFPSEKDKYKRTRKGWQLTLPKEFSSKILKNPFKPIPARVFGNRGYFSKEINGKIVRMWDFTEEQYEALIKLSFGLNKLLPRIKLKVPINKATGKHPLNRLKNFSRFAGILGHSHVQNGSTGLECKYDPGSAFNWNRLNRAFNKKT
ncbi:MAG: N-acetylmuramyl-L-alanine amidase [Nitrospinota bacterium]|nr:N-acetylmuramyl-L-alanine amidase [Nitrospinota bacterium]MEC9019166.1 N-acetylmuramyl-L-alanine amidase [Nitrospinota bacterium]